MNLDLKGRKAILPAASKGLGRATAELFAREGADVAICARGSEELEKTRKALAEHGGKVIADVVDIADAEAYKAWVASSADALGGCDDFIAFPSAGGAQSSEEVWLNAFNLDVMGAWRGLTAAMSWLEKSQAASIVVIASMLAIEPVFGPQPMAAMKAAATHQAGALAHQLGPKGIRVNIVSPGPIFIEGGVWDTIQRNRREFYDATLSNIPLGRFGADKEVAWAIGFLASPHSAFITGTNLVVDGGTLQRVQF